MKITKLLENLVPSFDSELEIVGLTLNSRDAKENYVFIALNGANHHGLTYAKSAVENGATIILFDEKDSDLANVQLSDCSVLKIAVANLIQNLGIIAARFYDNPSQKINVIGITGTNGKTSCSQFLAQTLENCDVIGTLGWGKLDNLQTTLNTTPDALAVQKMLATLKNGNCENVAMEVSSHGLAQGRVNEVQFKGAIFTNFSRDHLDYHGSMEEYLNTKLMLFRSPQLEFAVINLDDAVSEKVISVIPENVNIIGISVTNKICSRGQLLSAKNVELNLSGIQCEVSWKNQTKILQIPLIGRFNLENALCVLAAMLALNIKFDDAIERLKNIKAVIGRMESFGGKNEKPLVIVDYAHTPDALEKVLNSLRFHTKGKLSVVFGCGGNRDAGKRAEMGTIAEKLADWVILTDDNPRFESNKMIVQDILRGFTIQTDVIHDRKTAISTAIKRANAEDCVLIAGKGHENYQEINEIRSPFSDVQCVQKIMEQNP